MEEVWKDKKVDAAFLLESGLLFEINRSILHPIGISMYVMKDGEGRSTFGFKDSRSNPAEALYSRDNFKKGHKKLRRFMRNFGHKQLDLRSKKLGWSFQAMHIPDRKRHPND